MPKVYLRGRCSRPDDLPDVCMKCGAQADGRVTRTFNWIPPWVGLTILIAWPLYLILAIVLKKTAKVAVPLCEQHKGHWSFRLWLNLGSLLVLVGGSIGLAILIGSLSGPGPGNDLSGMAVLLVVVALVAWLVILVVTNVTAIRVEEITDDGGVRLTGVCSEFVDAYRDQEDRERAARRGAMERWDDRRGEDEDDRPRRGPRDERVKDGSDEEDERPRRRRESREDDY